MANWQSRSRRQLEQTVAEGFPVVVAKVGAEWRRSAGSLGRRSSVNSSVSSISIVVVSERGQLPGQIVFVPEQGVVEELAADGFNEAFDEGMGIGRELRTMPSIRRNM